MGVWEKRTEILFARSRAGVLTHVTQTPRIPHGILMALLMALRKPGASQARHPRTDTNSDT